MCTTEEAQLQGPTATQISLNCGEPGRKGTECGFLEADRTQTQRICGGSRLERWPGVLGRAFIPTDKLMKGREISDWSYETSSRVRAGSRSFHVKRHNGERKESFAPHSSHFSIKALTAHLPWVTSLPSFCLSTRKAANKEKWLFSKVSKVLLILPKHFLTPFPPPGTPGCSSDPLYSLSRKGQQLLPEEHPQCQDSSWQHCTHRQG